MRIIAGEWGGRRLQAPDGKDTRPMLGRVREALFSTLGNEVDEARVLDLFAGTGSLGMESLSRGAGFARFVERERKAGQILKGNLEAVGAGDRAEVALGDALAARQWGPEPWDIIYMDPPYPLVRDVDGKRRVLSAVRELIESHLVPRGVLMLHTEPRVLSEHDFDSAWDLDKRTYGRTVLWYLRGPGQVADETAGAPTTEVDGGIGPVEVPEGESGGESEGIEQSGEIDGD